MKKVALSLLACVSCIAFPVVAGETASITGVVDKPELVSAIIAVDRNSRKKFAGKLDAKSGQFIIDNLPLDIYYYDCIIDFGGARLEGVNLKVPRSDYVIEQPLLSEDVETITTKVRSMDKFADIIEFLAVEGNIQHAAVLLNKLRTRPFYSSKPGEVVWRVELWHFERPEETWAKVQHELFIVLYRERIPKDVFDKKSITFDPELGGLRLSGKRQSLDLGQIKLPPATAGIRLRSGKDE